MFKEFFRTPLRVSILSTLLSLLLTGVLSYILFDSTKPNYLLIMLMAVVIAGPVSYISSKQTIALRVTIENQNVKLALEQERADILAKFMRDAAHEFKTPLALMESSLYLLKKTPDSEKQQKYSQQASEQIQVLNRLLETILVLTRLDSNDKETYPRERIKATELVSDIRSITESKRVKLTMESPNALPHVKVNLLDIQFALKEIVGNALRFSPETSDVNVEMMTSNPWLILQITDHGSGMSVETVEHIFNRFYRADESHTTRGMGLGLAIAKQVIKLHDGRIEVQSEVGKGTTIKAYLPISYS